MWLYSITLSVIYLIFPHLYAMWQMAMASRGGQLRHPLPLPSPPTDRPCPNERPHPPPIALLIAFVIVIVPIIALSLLSSSSSPLASHYTKNIAHHIPVSLQTTWPSATRCCCIIMHWRWRRAMKVAAAAWGVSSVFFLKCEAQGEGRGGSTKLRTLGISTKILANNWWDVIISKTSRWGISQYNFRKVSHLKIHFLEGESWTHLKVCTPKTIL